MQVDALLHKHQVLHKLCTIAWAMHIHNNNGKGANGRN